MICPSGHTAAALRRAQDSVSIKLLPLESLDEFAWQLDECSGPCGKRKVRGTLFWSEFLDPCFSTLNRTVVESASFTGWVIVQVGICAACHSFHVWCWDCGEKFAIQDGLRNIVECGCGRLWGSVPESKESGHVGEPESIWLMMKEHSEGRPLYLDRKPIR
jgi:hypothetical protein